MLYIYERDFCDINHAQWRWGRGADLSTTRRPHINIRRIRGNLLLLNYPDENQSNKDWFIVGWEKSKLMNGNKHFGHLFSFSDFIKHLFHFHVVFDYIAFCERQASLKIEALNQNTSQGICLNEENLIGTKKFLGNACSHHQVKLHAAITLSWVAGTGILLMTLSRGLKQFKQGLGAV